jgi:predicted ATPase/class 3 adenylate cyclase/Tfp pilus assembly protein PilF
MPKLPSGTITFLFTDIEGSTPLWDQFPKTMRVSLERHNAILHEAIEAQGGQVYKTIGDEFQAAFTDPVKAIQAALRAQRGLVKEPWGETGPIRVRMGIHIGAAQAGDGDYVTSHTLNRVARVMGAGHGGQILISGAVAELVRGQLPRQVTLKDMGKHRLKGISEPEHIFQVVAPDLPEDFPPLVTRSVAKHNLPLELTQFVGRDHEVAEVSAMVADPACRMVSIVGPGGIGKSRLSVQVASHVLSGFPDGVWFVPLAPLTSADYLISAVASALELSFSGQIEPQEQLLNYLSDKETLLVLDNYEHLLPEGADLPIAIIQRTRGVKLLVSSRERLGLQGEWVYELRGMPYPHNGTTDDIEKYDAVALFLQHARQVSGFAMSEQEKLCISRLSRMVDGMPLALVLAASWMKTLNCQAIVKEIQRNLDFLATGLRDIPERHRSIQVVFEQSWKLLSREEQSAFKRLSVFRGGFQREAAEEVSIASLRVLASLVDKSLLQRDAKGRYQMQELLRQYAGEKLAESPEDDRRIHDLHCEFYADYLQERYRDLVSGRQFQAMSEILTELGNIRAAWEWALKTAKVEEIRKSAGSLFYFCQMRCLYREGAEEAENAARSLEKLKAGEVRDLTLATVLVYHGWFCLRLGKLDSARRVLERSQEIFRRFDNRFPYGWATDPTTALGVLAVINGDYEKAVRLGEQARQTNEARDDPWNLMFSYYVLTNAYLAQGKYTEASETAERAFAIAEGNDENWFRAYLLIDLGNVASELGEYERAREDYQASYEIRERFGDPEGQAVALGQLGEVAILQKDYAQAEEFYSRSVDTYQGIGDRGGFATALNGLGLTALHLGKIREAKKHLSAALQTATEIQYLPLTLSVMTNIGQLMLKSGEYKRGTQVLGAVLHHPAVDQPVKERVWKALADYEDQIPLEALKEAKERQPDGYFEGVVRSLLVELATA